MRIKGIRQHDIKDCGAACLATVCQYHGLKIPLVRVRELAKIDKNGVNLNGIVEAAKSLNFNAEALHGSFDDLVPEIKEKEIVLPIIAHVIMDGTLEHYVVISEVSERKVKIFDPARGKISYTFEQFQAIWTGYVVTLNKTEHFKVGNLGKGFLRKYILILKQQKKYMFVILVVSLLIASISILGSLAYQKVVDQFILGNNQVKPSPNPSNIFHQIEQVISNMKYLFIALIGLYIFQTLIYMIRGIAIAVVTKKIDEKLTATYFSKMLRLPVSFFQNRETGEVLSRFNDISKIRELISGTMLTMILDFVMGIAGAVVLISINLKLFVLVLLIVIAYAIVILFYRKPLAKVNRNIMESNAQMASLLKESIDGVETTKSFHGEEKNVQKLKARTQTFLKFNFRGNIVGTSLSAITIGVESIGIISVLWLGSLLVQGGHLSLGLLIAFQSLMYFFIAPIKSLIETQPVIQTALIAADRLNDVLEVTGEDELLTRNTIVDSLNKSIRFEQVSYSYGFREQVLNDLSITIPAGEKVAIVGKSGCGKTTLARLLSAFYIADKGKIMIGDIDINQIPLEVLRKKVIYVPQETFLFSGSLKDNLTLGMDDINEEELEKVIEGCMLKELMENNPFGIEMIISENGRSLSGGQRQRIAIARALLVNPEILILDEGTSHLDTSTEADVMDFIARKCKMNTCLFVTHNLDLARKCDHIIVMDDGRVVESGTHDELINQNGYYSKMNCN